MPNLDTLSITFKPSINGSAGKTITGAAYPPLGQSVALTKTVGPFTRTLANTAALGADEITSAIFTVAAGGYSTVALNSMTDMLLQSAVSLARVKAYRVQLLSVADDSTNGTACSGLTVNPMVKAPVQSAASTATTGGTLAAATYYYKITSTTAAGESTGSNEISQATTGTTSTVTLNWAAATNATGYKIYRGTSAGAENLLIATIASGATVTYVNTGGETTSTASPPAVNGAAALNAFQLSLATLQSGLTIGNGEYTEWATPNAAGLVVGTAVNLYLANNDATNAAAVQITLVGGTT